MINIYNDDVRSAIKHLDDNTFDAIITDPPYEIGFVGNAWDSSGVAFDTELWKEALRVLKPGGHLVSFGASRLVHRLAVAIEDAGFEIRDQFNWLYTSGMSKGENLAKRVDESFLYGNDAFKKKQKFAQWCKDTKIGSPKLVEAMGSTSASHYVNVGQPLVPSLEKWNIIKHMLPEPPKEIMDIIHHFDQPVELSKNNTGKSAGVFGERYERKTAYEPLTELGRAYDGYRVSLKPAFEPAVVARKPMPKGYRVSDNIVDYGTGALDIDGNRVNGRQASNILADADYFNGKAPGFLLQPKAPQNERVASSEGNKHPTVKPVALMEHLVGLYTPPTGGMVLDMFAGSGSTMVACANLGVSGVGIEMSAEYCEIIQKRLTGANIVGN